MNIDDLKNNWKDQSAPRELSNQQQITSIQSEMERLSKHIKKENRKANFSLIGAALYMVAMMIFFREMPWYYYAGLTGIIILMVVYVLIFRARQFDEKSELSVDQQTYIEQRIERLQYNKKVTRFYMPLYGLSLYVFIMMGMAGVAQYSGMTLNVQAWGFGLTTAWVVFIMWWGIRRQIKKEQKEIDPLLEQLKKMKT